MHKKIIGVLVLAIIVACAIGAVLLNGRSAQEQPSGDRHKNRQLPVEAASAPPAIPGVPVAAQPSPATSQGTATIPPVAPTAPQQPAAAAAPSAAPGAAQPDDKQTLQSRYAEVMLYPADTPLPLRLRYVTDMAKLDEEQGVMLQAYLEALDKFNRESMRAFSPAGGPLDSRGNPVPMMAFQQLTLDNRIAQFEIMAQELKEVRELRDQFMGSLDVKQKEAIAPLVQRGDL